jgi:hypothetical protein
MCFGIALAPASGRGAQTPINQNAIKQGKCGHLERGQTESDKSEQNQTLFQLIWNAVKQNAINQNELKPDFPYSESDKSKT